MAFDKKKIALTVIGGALAFSFVVFIVLFAKYDRGGDPNNEDALLALAQKAEDRDDPPAAADYWGRLVSLNPFKEEYKQNHFHALLRCRNFGGLMAYTNTMPLATSLTPEERHFEDLLTDIGKHIATGALDRARADLLEATNINYFAATPLLVDLEVRQGRVPAALMTVRPYIKRFPIPRLLVFAAEWCALIPRVDLIPEIRAACPANTRFSSVAFNYYCDAIEAWVKGDTNTLANAKSLKTDDYFRTPLSKLIRVEAAALGDDPKRVEIAYKELRYEEPFLDFHARGRRAVKNFIASHFPDKLPILQLGELADLALSYGEPDVDLLRVSLLAKFANDTLLEVNLAEAEQRFPTDKGIGLIRKWYNEKKSR